MPLQPLTQFIIDDTKHARLWENAIVIFDASSLLEMYFYSDETKNVVINEIFKRLEGRLWLPGQVNYEFLKNRSKVILKPKGSYTALEKEINAIVLALDKYKTSISEIKSKTKKHDKHPFLDQNIFNKLDEIQQQQDTELKALGDRIKEEIKIRNTEIEKTVDSDILYNAINSYFEVNSGFSFNEQMQIIEEGKKRYEFKIPPGYEDSEKEGTQIFGDLFAWKEIIDYAKKIKKSVIFITNDVKSDWCIRNESNSTYIEHPRHELIKEIWDTANVEFWMYSNPQLFYHAEKYLKSEISADQIKEVNTVAYERELSPENTLTCIFTWPVDQTTNNPGSYEMEKSLMYLLGKENEALYIDWGDGSSLETVTIRNAIFHTYPAFGEYTVRVYGNIFWFCAMGISSNRGIQYPKVSEIKFFNPLHLDRLQSFAGKLKELDVKEMINLTQLLAGHNSLTSLDIRPLQKLMLCFCEGNQLTELDLSQNLYLNKLNCSQNKLTALDLSNNNILSKVNCRGNQIKLISLRNNNNLMELNCAYNKLDKNALNSIFNDLPFATKGKICIVGNPGAESCSRIKATAKGWIFEENPNYISELI